MRQPCNLITQPWVHAMQDHQKKSAPDITKSHTINNIGCPHLFSRRLPPNLGRGTVFGTKPPCTGKRWQCTLGARILSSHFQSNLAPRKLGSTNKTGLPFHTLFLCVMSEQWSTGWCLTGMFYELCAIWLALCQNLPICPLFLFVFSKQVYQSAKLYEPRN